VEDLGIQGMWG